MLYTHSRRRQPLFPPPPTKQQHNNDNQKNQQHKTNKKVHYALAPVADYVRAAVEAAAALHGEDVPGVCVLCCAVCSCCVGCCCCCCCCCCCVGRGGRKRAAHLQVATCVAPLKRPSPPAPPLHKKTTQKGDVLVFLTGEEEVTAAVSLLADEARRLAQGGRLRYRLLPLPLYSGGCFCCCVVLFVLCVCCVCCRERQPSCTHHPAPALSPKKQT